MPVIAEGEFEADSPGHRGRAPSLRLRRRIHSIRLNASVLVVSHQRPVKIILGRGGLPRRGLKSYGATGSMTTWIA